MQELLTNRKWRLRNSWWVLLAAMPYISCLAFFHIGYKAKRRSWTGLGILSAVLWGTRPVVTAILQWHAVRIAGMDAGVVLLLLLLAAGIAAALLLRSGYLKLLASREARQPEPPVLLADRRWRIRNSLWILWSLLPGLGAAGIIHANHRLKSRRLAVAGVLFAVFDTCYVARLILQFIDSPYSRKFLSQINELIASVLSPLFQLIGINYYSYRLEFLKWMLCAALFIAQFYICCAVRRPYLYAIAPSYEQTRRDYPCLTSWGWRTLRSWWVPVSLIPYCAGAGLIFAGAQTRKRKWLIGGAALTILIASVAIVTRLLQNGAVAAAAAGQITDYARAQTVAFSRLVHMTFSRLLAIVAFAASTILREDYLVNRAARLNGYTSQIDRELAEQELMRRFAAKQKPAEEAAVPEPQPQTVAEKSEKREKSEKKPRKALLPRKQEKPAAPPAVKPAPQPEAEPGTLIDINTCQESELRSLPGVGVVQAKQAMDYRDRHGGFASVDEFVDVLALKPHFAAQIFRMAVVSAQPEKPQGQKPAKRKFDL